MLSLSPQVRAPVVAGLEGVLSSPEAFDDDTTIFLALSAARSRLIRDRRPDAVEARAALVPGARGIPRMARAGELAAASRARRRRLRFGLWAPGRGAPCAQAAIYLVYTR